MRGDVAVVTFDLPGEPVNTLSPAVGAEFTEELERLGQDEAVKAIVFTSAKQDFVVGADVKWLGSLRTAARRRAGLARGPARIRPARGLPQAGRRRHPRRVPGRRSRVGPGLSRPGRVGCAAHPARSARGAARPAPRRRRHAAAAAPHRRPGRARPHPHREGRPRLQGAQARPGRRGGPAGDPGRHRGGARPGARRRKGARRASPDPPRGGDPRGARGQPHRPATAVRRGAQAAAEEERRPLPGARARARGRPRGAGEGLRGRPSAPRPARSASCWSARSARASASCSSPPPR